MKNFFSRGLSILLCFVLLFGTFGFVDSHFAYAGSDTEMATIDFSGKDVIKADTEKYSIVIKDANGKEYSSDDTGKVFHVPVTGGDSYYTYQFIPEDGERYWGSNGRLWVYGDINFKPLNLSDGRSFLVVEKENVTIKVPSGANICFCNRVKLYRELEKVEGTKLESEDSFYDTYSFAIPKTKSGYFVVEKEGCVKWAGYLEDFTHEESENGTVYKLERLTDNSTQIIRDETQKYYEAGILLNGPSSKFIELKVGEYFDIYAFRAWQAIDSETGNDYVDPDFNYKVLDGDSVEVSTDGRIKAVKPGLSIVKVGYDALEYSDSHARASRLVYSACWPEKAGIYAVNVGKNNNEEITTGIELSEYDTLYYMSKLNGEPTENDDVEYTFKPTVENNESMTVRVAKPTIKENGTITYRWEDVIPATDGTCQVKLPKGRNVIEITSADNVQCHVVNVDDVEVEILNKDRPEQEFIVGDTALIKFKGLTTPIPKMGAIYNPAGVLIHYNNESTEVVSNSEVQYKISTDAELEVPITESGEVLLTNGHLESSVWGDSASSLPTQHQRMTKGGNLATAYDGGDNPLGKSNELCILPDISFTVTDAWDKEELTKQEAGYLKSVKIGTTSGGKQVKELSQDILRVEFNNLISINTKKPNYKNKPLYITVEPVDKQAKIKIRTWKGSDKGNAIVTDYESSQELANKITVISDIIWVEIIVKPEDGYSKTYTYAIQPYNLASTDKSFAKTHPYIDSVEIKPVDGKFSVSEGLVAAKPFETNGMQIDFGYGICWYEREYTVSIPTNVSKITSSIALIDADNHEYPAGKTISLNEGSNIFTATANANNGNATAQYKFEFQRENAYQVKVVIPDNASVEIKNARGKKMEAENDIYRLPTGEYTAYVEKKGYITKVQKFTVENEEKVVTISDLEMCPNQVGNVTVRIKGFTTNIRSDENIAISDPENLKERKYVEYNHGGYTALHAMIRALDNGISKAKYKCVRGRLTPSIDVSNDSVGSNAGWICEINGNVCGDPANKLVNGGDIVEYYYNADYEGMQHAAFAENVQQTLSAGNSLTLTLLSKDAGTDGAKKACAGADILLNGQSIELETNEEGKVTIPAEKINIPGHYTITASKKNESGQNILTYTVCILTVKKADTQQQTGKTTVTFRLIGDAVHSGGASNHSKYVTWIATKYYTFNKESVSVYELFTKALRDAGLSYIGAESNYVSSIQAPKGYGEYWLSEFTNGKNSGWMYTVNGEHPLFGLKEYYVTNGDSVVWHYVDDYKQETSFEGSTPIYQDRWLEAEDTDPPTDKVIDMSGKGEAKDVTTSGASGSATTTSPTEVKVSGTTAAATVKAENQSEILKQATENKSAEIVLEVAASDTKGAENVQLQLETSFVKNISDKTNASLTLDTENGSVSFDQEAIKAIISEAKGSTIFIEIAKVTKPTEAQKKAAGTNGDIFRLVVKSGDKIISEFNKGKATVRVEIPAKLADKKVAALHIADDAKIEQLAGKVLTISGKKYFEFITPHFSTFALVDADELGLEVEEPQVDAKALTAKLTPIARSAKTAKKNVKVTVSLDKQDKAIIKELKDAGYTVKYRFYRSTKKAAGYKAAVTKKTASYTNTSGKKGTKYFYKVQVRVYNENGKLTAKTALKQCKYASRIWTK